MKTAFRIALKMMAGGGLALIMPREGMIEGSTRIIPFFALLMAGVFPAMMQTVTVLKGDDLSPKLVREYGDALTEQLRFWAALIATALVAVGSLTMAVVINKAQPLIVVPFEFYLSRNFVVDLFIFGFGCAASSVIGRFVSAYGGLKSLLRLNLQLATKRVIRPTKKLLRHFRLPKQMLRSRPCKVNIA